MKLSIRDLFLAFFLFLGFMPVSHSDGREAYIRAAILDNGFTESEKLNDDSKKELAPIGETFFRSEHLSLNGKIACATCHIDAEGSSDGLPNAAGVRGYGEGVKRFRSGAKIVPRNTLGLWGVGSIGHVNFFWDGKLVKSAEGSVSQFGTNAPSKDLLVVAAHLPAVEIRETLEEDAFILANKKESVEGVQVIYQAIVKNLIKHEPQAVFELAEIKKKTPADLSFTDIAEAIAAFIREDFKIRETRLERFVFGEERLTTDELKGAEIFYGKGGCSLCHSGPLFSDQQFHTVVFPSLGFGKNGFGVDYGRYNVTFNPADLYKFRTPILFNVEKTKPYGHSGSVNTIRGALISHVDPLRLIDLEKMDSLGRHELSKIMANSDVIDKVSYVSDEEIDNLTSFLKTLSY